MLATADNFGLSFGLEVVGLVLVTWFVIKKFPGPLVKQGMDHKLDEIRSQLSAGEQAAAAGAALVAQRVTELEEARSEAAAIVEHAGRGAEIVRVEGERAADEEYERQVRRAHGAVDAARGAVRADILGRVGTLVLEATTEVVDAELDAPTQRRLLDEAITATEAEAR